MAEQFRNFGCVLNFHSSVTTNFSATSARRSKRQDKSFQAIDRGSSLGKPFFSKKIWFEFFNNSPPNNVQKPNYRPFLWFSKRDPLWYFEPYGRHRLGPFQSLMHSKVYFCSWHTMHLGMNRNFDFSITEVLKQNRHCKSGSLYFISPRKRARVHIEFSLILRIENRAGAERSSAAAHVSIDDPLFVVASVLGYYQLFAIVLAS